MADPERRVPNGDVLKEVWHFQVSYHHGQGLETSVRHWAFDTEELRAMFESAVRALEEDIRIGKEVQRQMDANPEGPFMPWPPGQSDHH